jgi:protein-S-isoprenylcysteine O-methyltransferase Ste14
MINSNIFNIIVLIVTLILFLLVLDIVLRAIIKRQPIIGRPPIPVVFFILAKMLVMVNLSFLLMRGFNISVHRIYRSVPMIDGMALILLITGLLILIQSTIQLNKDLIFGLSDSAEHKLQTRGLFSISRHPFYLGFIFILFSSCLLYPNYVNFLAFIGAWCIHHFIMVSEEKFLESVYGEEYRLYKKRVKRYISLKYTKL